MGSVYRAVDGETGLPVALKLMRAQAGDMERFATECRLLAELAHPAIVRYIEHGSHRGALFLAMEWLDGETLEERLAREPLGVVESIDLLRGVAAGLAAAHARAIVHRDVKPSNVMLVNGDPSRAKLLDFGIARLQVQPSPRTRTGTIVGSVGYMAPEQARGVSDVDVRADVFALGCVLFECLTGQPAFLGANVAATLAKVILDDAPRLGSLRPDLPPELDALIARMLAKGRDDRPRDAQVLLDELGRLPSVTGAPPIARLAPVVGPAERRLLAVILARRLDERAARTIVAPFGGEPALLADGTVLITFGALDSATDLAAQAASCALAIRAAQPDARLGLATGQAETSDVHPVGPVIDRAAALLDGPQEPGIPIDEVTADLLDARFEVRAHGRTRMLLGKADASVARTLLGLQTPFVGRENELALLEATASESFRDHAARAVLVTAPAGAGKSRLGYELAGRMRRATKVAVLVARADPMSAGSSLGLARQLVRQAAGLRDSDAPARQYAQLTAYLSSRGDDDVEWLAELVQAPIEIPSATLRAARDDPRLMIDRMQRAFLDWLAAECAAHPVLLVLEDLHWGDASSVAWLSEAMHELADRPLMVLAFGRPEVRGQFSTLWTQEISLGALTRRAAERLVRSVLGDAVPREVVERVVERSEGNAYYLEELIRRVAEGGSDELPGTVLAMVQSRLERLEPDARRVLRAASVFGETFWDGAASALLGGAARADDVTAWLQALATRELVRKRITTRFAGHTEYTFRHGLMRDTAYSMLTDDDRAAAHRLAGAWLDGAGEKDPRVIADHFELGRSPAQAITWLVRAAQVAFDTAQFEAFLALSERGIALGAGGAPRGMLRQMQARHHFLRNELPRAMACAREALELLPLGTIHWFHAAGIATATTFSHLKDPEIAHSVARSLESLPDVVDQDWPFVWAVNYIAWVFFHVGGYAEAVRLAAWAERSAARKPDHDPTFVIFLHALRALIAFIEGDPGTALRETRSVVSGLDDQKAGMSVNLAIAVFVASLLFLHLGCFEEYVMLARREWRGESDLPALRAWHVLGFAVHELTGGNAAPLVAIGERFVETTNLFQNSAVRAYVAEAHLADGRPDVAEAFARPVLETGCPGAFRNDAVAILARAALMRGDPVTALAITESGSALRDTATCVQRSGSMLRLTRIEALLALGETAAARDELGHARDRILRMAATLDADPHSRAQFIDGLPDNRRTLELAEKLAGSA